jgi:N-acetylmuramoyl-L-alanine amidase
MRIKRILSVIIIGIMISNVYVKAEEQEQENKGIILIDPGHGGIDGGAKS